MIFARVWTFIRPATLEVVAKDRKPTNIAAGFAARTGAAAPTDVAAAKAALNCIGFGQEALNSLSDVVWRALLIVSGEGPSRGKDSDFVVVM